MDEIMVSVCCLVYNHEKYLRKCLDGFVNQRCDFKYEVLIHDDASTDSSPAIIREYEEKYPDIIKPIFQTQNQYSKGVKISLVYQYPRAKGKYIALCEGDDYWTDPNKLQKQFDIMEQYSDCGICFHQVACIDESGAANGNYIPTKYNAGVYSGENLVELIAKKGAPFHTSSFFADSESLIEYCHNTPEFACVPGSGDVPIMLYFASFSCFYYVDEVMSHYRVNSIGSWSMRMQARSKQEKDRDDSLFYKRMDLYDQYTNGRFHDYCELSKDLRRFKRAMIDKDYRTVTRFSNRIFLKNYPAKAKIKLFCYRFFPKLMERYDQKKG